MPESYKLHVKLGGNEFNAEGPEEQVKADYERFLSALAIGRQTGPANYTLKAETGAYQLTGSPVALLMTPDQTLLDRVYAVDRERGVVSLRVLPNDTTNREADAVILLLYGFRQLLGQREVLVTRLNEGLRQSGLSVERLDRFMGAHSGLVMRGGSRSGGRYTLNNVGVQTAENWLRTKFPE